MCFGHESRGARYCEKNRVSRDGLGARQGPSWQILLGQSETASFLASRAPLHEAKAFIGQCLTYLTFLQNIEI